MIPDRRQEAKDKAFARFLLASWWFAFGFGLARCSWIIFRDVVLDHSDAWFGNRFPYFMAVQVLGFYAAKMFSRSFAALNHEE